MATPNFSINPLQTLDVNWVSITYNVLRYAKISKRDFKGVLHFQRLWADLVGGSGENQSVMTKMMVFLWDSRRCVMKSVMKV